MGLDRRAVERRLARRRLVIVEEGVFAVPPVLDDDWGRWMGATLTAPGTFLSRVSAAAAREFWSLPRDFETVTRLGSGGPRRHDGVLVCRSSTLAGDTEELRGVPITTVPRTLLDLSGTARISDRGVAYAVREAIRLGLTTVHVLVDFAMKNRGRRGVGRLLTVLTRYSGLPVARARSGAEVLAMEILQRHGFELPALNVRRAGEEADLSWPAICLIIEIDGAPFHLDSGEDERKRRIWEGAGWTVRRISSDDVYEAPDRLLALAATSDVPHYPA